MPRTQTTSSELGSEALLEAAEAIVAHAANAPGVEDAEARVALTVNSFCRFADVGPTQSAERARLDVDLRLRTKGADGGLHEASVSGQSLDLDSIEALVARGRELADVSPALDEPVPLGGAIQGDRSKLRGRPDAQTVAHDGAAKAPVVDAAVRRCEEAGLMPAGLFDTTGVAKALANSAGRAVHFEGTRAGFSLTASERDGNAIGGAGWNEGVANRVGDLDTDSIARIACEKAAPGVARVSVEPGEYTVVLEPSAVSSLLLFASYVGFGAKDVAERSSFLCERIGEPLFREELCIRDRWNHPLYQVCGFDGEGTPTRALALLEKGALTGPVTNRLYAHKNQDDPDASTGHCIAGSAGPRPQALSIDAGDQSREALVAGVERGLLVTQFHYTNLIDPREMLLTGMTRNGLFLIENGEVTRPLTNLRFTQGLVTALQNVAGIGDDLDVAGALFDGEVIVPSLRIDGFRFTSATDF